MSILTYPRWAGVLAALLATAAVWLAGTSTGEAARVKRSAPKPTVVLVHGAFADASGWAGEIARLQKAGYPVIAPANPLRGVAADAAYLDSVLATISGPKVLVGHSYGGEVITNAKADGVKALVYIAAFAPDEGESQIDIATRFPGAELGLKTILARPFDGGVDQYINPADFRSVFAADQPKRVAAVMAASQRPLALAASLEKSGPPAWKTVPSWFMVAKQDHAIDPNAERFMAKRAGSKTVEVKAPHDVLITHPAAVTSLIEAAAR